jgi:hypothetical protein
LRQAEGCACPYSGKSRWRAKGADPLPLWRAPPGQLIRVTLPWLPSMSAPQTGRCLTRISGPGVRPVSGPHFCPGVCRAYPAPVSGRCLARISGPGVCRAYPAPVSGRCLAGISGPGVCPAYPATVSGRCLAGISGSRAWRADSFAALNRLADRRIPACAGRTRLSRINRPTLARASDLSAALPHLPLPAPLRCRPRVDDPQGSIPRCCRQLSTERGAVAAALSGRRVGAAPQHWSAGTATADLPRRLSRGCNRASARKKRRGAWDHRSPAPPTAKPSGCAKAHSAHQFKWAH